METGSQSFQSKDLVEVKGFSNGWLFYFSDLQVEHKYLSQGVYYLCYKYVDQADLEPGDIPTFSSQLLEVKAYTCPAFQCFLYILSKHRKVPRPFPFHIKTSSDL